VLVVH